MNDQIQKAIKLIDENIVSITEAISAPSSNGAEYDKGFDIAASFTRDRLVDIKKALMS